MGGERFLPTGTPPGTIERVTDTGSAGAKNCRMNVEKTIFEVSARVCVCVFVSVSVYICLCVWLGDFGCF